jgi:putative phage-type endonuclease
MNQRDQEWFAMRAGKFTGSRFSALMARTRSGVSASRDKLIDDLACERRSGECEPTYQNAAMLRGTELEPEARSAYEARMGVLVEEVAFIVHPEYPNVGVSPDGLVGDEGMVEIKCPDSKARHMSYLLEGKHVNEYWWQLQGQLWVAGRKWVDAVSYDPRWSEERHRLAIVKVKADPKAHAELAAEVEKAEAEIQAKLKKLEAI